jgi:hypothetical protein
MMTENQREWLKGLYRAAAEDHGIAASNEHLWALGSNDGETAAMHERNAEEHRDFAGMLRGFADKI